MRLRELLSGPEKWTKAVEARDCFGRPVLLDHPDAVSWCLVGGFWKVYQQDSREIFERKADLLKTACYRLFGTRDFVSWQDAPGTTWEQVDLLLNEAGV